MKTCKSGIARSVTLVTLVALLAAAFKGYAQLPGGAPGGINAALIKLFGDVTFFSAQTEVRVLDKAQQETLSVPMDFALLDKMIRVSLDLSRMKSKDVPPGTADTLKQLGMARVISVVRPDKKVIHIIYPDQKCYLDMPMPAEEIEAMDKNPKIEKTALGKETLDGHACVKNKVVVGSGDKGQSVEATTWNAADLKDFPIQIQTEEKGNATFLRFKQVQLTKPESKDFDVPAGYKQYADQQELIFGIMKKAEAGAEKK